MLPRTVWIYCFQSTLDLQGSIPLGAAAQRALLSHPGSVSSQTQVLSTPPALLPSYPAQLTGVCVSGIGGPEVG